ncbi:MAG: SUMF1/EgtB/PvdO family nonheme iron enzyme [Acidobacteria bacterium]|nr:SUMF1/EgtB/PvdO family nonheme iron enzyme [Acidobacteriota bacterium]
MGPRKVDALLRKVLDRMGAQPNLADRAKCVGLIGGLLPDLVGYTVSDERYSESLRLVMDIFDAEKSRSVPFQDRLAAAEALGQAGDPRLAKHEWVTIPAARAPNREPQNWDEQQEHPNWPVVNVAWHQATAYCEWAGGRLPTEEEWERAARGPNCTKYPWGNEDINPSRANYDESKIGRPTPVGLYPSGASAEGAYDMVGNVFEWTSSEWSKGRRTYVWRGGSFGDSRRNARSSYRDSYLPVGQDRVLGFRLAGGIT